MSFMLTGPRAVISTAALIHNFGVVKRSAPNARVLAVIKANAYGHGITRVAQALTDADAFGVARISEAMAVRAAGVSRPILLLEGVFSRVELEIAAQENFWIVVHNFEQISLLESWAEEYRFDVWLKIDTGMHRLGFDKNGFSSAWQRVTACRAVTKNVRLMTHLASSESPDSDTTRQQLHVFETLTSGLAAERSVANSAAIIGLSQSHGDWVRPGIMLYGISPFEDRVGHELGLIPAMSLESSLIAVHYLSAGETVGYGGTWICKKRTRVGVVAIGYGDGYPRHTESGAPVKIAGHMAAVAGRVSMDMIGVELGDVFDFRVGASVQVWGPELPVESVARYAKTIPYELVCGISSRVRVEYI